MMPFRWLSLLAVCLVTNQVAGEYVLREITDFEELSQTLQLVQGPAKQATVCIELENGGSGSGVVVSPDGLILSAAHVTLAVDQEFEVVFEDGTRYKAVGLGMNTSSDASMAQIIPRTEGQVFPFVSMQPTVGRGEYVFALGHSGGFDQERGLVLRLGRVQDVGVTSLTSDCTLIGGDSGGPLFNLKGQLVGIHSRVGTITNSNTHVPIAEFQKYWADLRAKKLFGDGSFASAGIPFLGMQIIQKERVLMVFSVEEESKAAITGIFPSDILKKINGKDTMTIASVLVAMQAMDPEAPEHEVELTIQRGEETLLFTITI